MDFNPKLLLDEFPHKHVPRNFEGNLFYRRDLRAWLSEGGEESQSMLLGACRRDVLFFANALCWTMDSKRHPGKPVRPWITFQEFQDDLFYQLEEMWGPPDTDGQTGFDGCWVKCRDVGVSHIPLIACYRRFALFGGQIFYLVSEREQLVDDRANPGAMLPKVDFIHSKMPAFMVRDVERRKLTYYHVDEDGEPDLAGGIIKGCATTDIATAATRPTAIIADEFGIWDMRKSIGFLASSAGASNSRLFMGTPKGQGNGFHKVATETDIPRTNIHWTQHPWHRRGLYRSLGEQGTIQYEDESFWATERLSWLKKSFPLLARKITVDGDSDPLLRDCYPFMKDAKVRSPYYDHECARSPFPWQIAQEHDLDFHGSGSPFYDQAQLTAYIERYSMVPIHRGTLTCDPFTFEPDDWADGEAGHYFLWCNMMLHKGQRFPTARGHRCIMGADVSAGTGASSSAISVWDCVTREKVFRWMRRDVGPHALAEVAFPISKWFGGCKIIFESGAHGSTFGQRLRELKANIFTMEDKKGKKRPNPGLSYEGSGKLNLCTNYGAALFRGEAMNRDRQALKEGFAFQLGATSLVEHVDSLNKTNPAGAKKNHGDAWMADCLAWFLVRGRGSSVDRRRSPVESEVDEETQKRLEEIEEKRYARAKW